MVDDDRSQVIHAGARVGAASLVQVGEQVVGHVEPGERELDVRVHLRPGVRAPPEALQVQAQHLQERTIN